jgi:GNAT superfamily N-acetyltransferase
VKTTVSDRFHACDKMGADVEIRPAAAADVPHLVETQIRAFHDDSRRFARTVGGGEPGGPPGYDSPEWQTEMMRRGRYFTLRSSGTIAGGMIVFRAGDGSYNLGRIWLDPAFQDLGIGRVAIEYLHEMIGPGCTWTLDTPSWAVRNHHFYESLGYRKVGEEAMPDGWVSWLYRRDAAATA